MSQELPPVVVLYDGECGLCDASVQLLLDWDKDGVLHYTPQQGPVGQEIFGRHPEVTQGSTLVVVVQTPEGERLLTRSTGIFHIVSLLRMPYRALSWLRWIPRLLTDTVYDLIARNRLKIWGRLDACRMPTPSEKKRFV